MWRVAAWLPAATRRVAKTNPDRTPESNARYSPLKKPRGSIQSNGRPGSGLLRLRRAILERQRFAGAGAQGGLGGVLCLRHTMALRHPTALIPRTEHHTSSTMSGRGLKPRAKRSNGHRHHQSRTPDTMTPAPPKPFNTSDPQVALKPNCAAVPACSSCGFTHLSSLKGQADVGEKGEGSPGCLNRCSCMGGGGGGGGGVAREAAMTLLGATYDPNQGVPTPPPPAPPPPTKKTKEKKAKVTYPTAR